MALTGDDWAVKRRDEESHLLDDPKALARALAAIPGTVGRYAVSRAKAPSKLAGDVSALGGALKDSFAENPSGFIADAVFSPWSALRDTSALRAQARQLRAAGDDADAGKLEQLAVASLLGAVPVAGKIAKTGIEQAIRQAPRFAVKEADGVLRVAPRGVSPQIVPEARAADLPTMRAILSDPAKNQPARIASDYTLSQLGWKYDASVAPPSSLEKQSGIGRVYKAAADNVPGYKHAIFEEYGRQMPEVVERSGARNYDQLTEAAYRKLAEETKRQFNTMPVETIYHPGNMEYASPNAMFQDVVGNGKLRVFRGGEPNPFMREIDPETGLSVNEMFRGVHDYFGHVPGGRNFQREGEEAAYGSHSQMMSPLAQMALLSETRGQNSFVNHTPVNARLIGEMEDIRATLKGIKNAKKTLAEKPAWHHESRSAANLLENAPDPEQLRARLRELGGQWQYAPQADPLLLPPQYLPVDSPGGVPDFIRSIIKPDAGTTLSSRGVHMGVPTDLSVVDPNFYGAGHRGAEYAIASRGTKGAPKRSYFYLGDEGTINPEEVLFARGDRVPYEAQLSGLYDTSADPAGLRALANAYKHDTTSTTSELERMAREYGYSGISDVWPDGQRPAMVFDPTPVRRIPVKPGHRGYAEGGPVLDGVSYSVKEN